MSQIAELVVLQRQVAELEDSVKTIERGLTKKESKLRDEFAIAAMQALIGNPLNISDSESRRSVAERAYQMADMMLAVRNKE